MPDTNCIAKENILGHIVAQGRRKKKKGLSLGHCPESKSFEVVLFSPILTLFWTLNGGRMGGDHVPKVLRHFLPKFWVNI